MLVVQELVAALSDRGVDYVIVLGMAAVIHGSAHVTADLDVCYERSRENCERLAQALAPFHPVLRGAPPELPFRLDGPTLRAGLNFTLVTALGDVDLLGEISGLGGFEKVRAAAEEVELFGRRVWVLGLDGLILAKRAAGRGKDLSILPELEALAALRKKKAGQ